MSKLRTYQLQNPDSASVNVELTQNGGAIVSGVLTATSGFSGDLTGNVTGNVTGSITGDISGNATGLSGSPNLVVGILTATDVVVTGDLTVQGTTTTLDTILTEVDKLEVGANNTTVGVAVTQSGSGYAMTVEGGNVGINTNTPQVTADIGGDLQVSGNIYGGHLGRKNWFDNGDFTSVQRYINTGFAGNHHPYGWIADRFQNRSAATVNWTRSTNVPTGKGFIYSAQVGSGTAGATCQTVELQAQGEEGVFAVGTFWCVSLWSTQPINRTSNNGFCQDLSATDYVPLTVRTPSSGSAYLSTGETAAGTSSGTFTRYYQIFEVTSGAHANNIGLSFGWAFNYSGSGTLEFTGFQLEQVANANCKPTAYEHVDIATQQRRCQRYAWRNDTSRILNGYKRGDNRAYFQLRCPVKPSHLIAPGSSNPMAITAWDYGIFTNHQSTLQNPAGTSINLFEFDSNSGYFSVEIVTAYSSTHVFIPSWESAEFEVTHGFF